MSLIDLRGTSLTINGAPFQLGRQDRLPAPVLHVYDRISCIGGGRLTEVLESFGTVEARPGSRG